jgi:hypothetical protein
MATQIYHKVRQAILDKRPMEVVYKGLTRLVCPHVLGSTARREHALFYQFGGQSESGLKPDGSPENWRCMFLSEIDSAEIITGRWHTARNWSVDDQSCVAEVDISV